MRRTPALEQILADAREESAILRRAGHAAQADSIQRLCDMVGEAAIEYMTWITEEEAQLRSGRSVPWLRAQFAAWAEQGHVQLDGRRRLYRMLIVPRRARIEEARQRGLDRGTAA